MNGFVPGVVPFIRVGGVHFVHFGASGLWTEGPKSAERAMRAAKVGVHFRGLRENGVE